jgi:hypothetical protein
MASPPDRASKPSTFRDLPGNIRRSELVHLQEVIRGRVTITSELLSDWVSSSDNRRALLDATVWGVIRWPKTLGLPQTPRLADGFSVVHQSKKDVTADDGTGTYPDGGKSMFLPQAAPSVWDSSSESEYRVSFFFFAPADHFTMHRLIVQLASVPWNIGTPGTRGTLRLSPFGIPDFWSLDRPFVIPPFEVKLDLYRRTFSIWPLGPSADL